MRNLVWVFLLAIGQTVAWAQQSVNIGVAVLDRQEVLPEGMDDIVAMRLTDILARNGVVSELCGDFVLYSQFSVLQCDKAEGGMRTMYKVEVEMMLGIEQISTKSVFASYKKTLKGTGFSRERAISEAVKNINTADKAYSAFVAEGENKIIEYYTANLDKILQRAQGFAQREQLAEALNLLFTYPANLEGRERVESLAVTIYQQYIDKTAANWMQEARVLMNGKAYEEALAALAQVHPWSLHFKQAQTMAMEIGTKIEKRDAIEREYQERQNTRTYKLEQQAIAAAKDVAIEWAKANKHDYYNIIVK